MKTLRRILLALLILIVLFVGSLILVPILFKDRLVAAARDLINEQVDADVNFEDVNLNLIRHFPSPSVVLEHLSIDGKEPFEGIRLLELEQLDLSVNLFSLFGDGPIELRSIRLIRPNLKVYVLQNGKANYDIVKSAETTPDTTSAEGSDVSIKLTAYEIVDGNLIYDDRLAELYTRIRGLNHKGSGNFSQDLFDLTSRTDIAALTVRSAGTTYLKEAALGLTSVLAVNQTESRYQLKKTELDLNALRLDLAGEVGLLANDVIDLDLSLKAPGNSFKEILSLVPGTYTDDFGDVKAEGNFQLQADVKGAYDPNSEDYPSFHLDLKIENGSVQYPDLPLPVSDIQLASRIDHPGGKLDRMEIELDPFRLQVGDNPFGGRLSLRTPISDPDVDTRIQGVLDLSNLRNAIPLEGIEELSGRIEADLVAKARLSQVEAGAYEDVNVSGNLRSEGLRYAAEGQPPITLENAGLAFSPRFVEVSSFSAQLGKSDLNGKGRIDNILAWFSPSKTMTGQFTLKSRLLDANEWSTEEAEVDEQSHEIDRLNAEAEMEEETEMFDRFDFSLDSRFDQILYEDYDLRNARVAGQLSPKRLNIQELSGQVGLSDLRLNGQLLHVWDYLFGDGILAGKLNLNSNRLNLNELLDLDEEVAEDPPMASEDVEAESVYEVPDNLNLVVRADIGRVDYTNMTLNQLSGEVIIKDEAVILDGVSAQALGGRINLTGRYDSKGEGNPEVAMKLGLQQLEFAQAFNTFNTFERLAPIGKFLNGRFNTDLLFEGEMGENMYPVLSTLDAEGFIETLDAVLQQFKPAQAIGNALNVQELKEAIPLQDTRNWFEIQKGNVIVKPVDIPIRDMNFRIAGRQGLNAEMDYTIDARIPRAIWENNAAGQAISAGADQLRQQAEKLGISWEKSEFLDLQLGLTGTLTQPKVKVNLLGSETTASLGEAAKQKAEEEAGKLLEEGKEQAQEMLDQARDTASKRAEEVLKDAVGQAKESISKDTNVKKAIDSLGSVVGQGLKEAIGDTSKTVETIKEELQKFNPFKRKKKEGSGN